MNDYTEFSQDKMHSTARKNTLALVDKINDPANRAADNIVYLDMPRVKSREFGGYPFIVVEEYTLNDNNDALNGLRTGFDYDIELHVYGLRDTDSDQNRFNKVLDQITALVKTPESIELNTGAEAGNLQFIRQNRMPGINEARQPVQRYEFEIRGKLHVNAEKVMREN